MEPLELSFTVACPPEHAFAVWDGLVPHLQAACAA